MACGCNSANVDSTWEVTLPNGSTFDVKTEAQARAEITKAGGGKYRRK